MQSSHSRNATRCQEWHQTEKWYAISGKETTRSLKEYWFCDHYYRKLQNYLFVLKPADIDSGSLLSALLQFGRMMKITKQQGKIVL